MDLTNVLSTFNALILHWTLGKRVSKLVFSLLSPAFQSKPVQKPHFKPMYLIDAALDPEAAN